MGSEVRLLFPPPSHHAGVTQWLEFLPSKQAVEGSNPFTRSIVIFWKLKYNFKKINFLYNVYIIFYINIYIAFHLIQKTNIINKRNIQLLLIMHFALILK